MSLDLYGRVETPPPASAGDTLPLDMASACETAKVICDALDTKQWGLKEVTREIAVLTQRAVAAATAQANAVHAALVEATGINGLPSQMPRFVGDELERLRAATRSQAEEIARLSREKEEAAQAFMTRVSEVSTQFTTERNKVLALEDERERFCLLIDEIYATARTDEVEYRAMREAVNRYRDAARQKGTQP